MIPASIRATAAPTMTLEGASQSLARQRRAPSATARVNQACQLIRDAGRLGSIGIRDNFLAHNLRSTTRQRAGPFHAPAGRHLRAWPDVALRDLTPSAPLSPHPSGSTSTPDRARRRA